MEATSEIKYLALEATKKLQAKGHEKWILKCFRKNRAAAERALGLTLEMENKKIKNCPGALFTWWFKRLKKR